MRRKVMIVEPSEVIVEGLTTTLQHNDLRVVEPEADAAAMMERLDIVKPDVVIVNPTIIDNVAELRNGRSVAVVALVYQYVKQSRLRHFDAVIDIRDSKQSILQQVLNLSVKREGDGDSAMSNHELTRRETAVLVEVARGLSNKEIATKLNVSVFTVTTHRKNIIKKTGIKSVAGLTVYALINNLIDEDGVV